MGGAVLTFRDDGGGTSTMTCSEALAQAVARAVHVSAESGDFPLSFTSLFAGLAGGDDEIGTWLRQQFARSGNLEALLARPALKRVQLQGLRQAAPAPKLPIGRTASARSALTEGQRVARDLGSRDVDTRHVLFAYLTLGQYHEDDFRTIITSDRVRWGRDLVVAMASAHPEEPWMRAGATAFGYSADVATPTGEVASREPVRDDALVAAMEGSTALALQEAIARAGNERVRPSHALQGIAALGTRTQSPAFRRFLELARITPGPTDRELYGNAPLDLAKLDPALLDQLRWAFERPTVRKDDGKLWGRDLVTAALLAGDEAGSVIEGSLRELRDAWHGYVCATEDHRTVADWNAWWARAGVPLPEELLTGLATETSAGVDKLGVVGEAGAFARLILDRKVEAPLSIGLLGDWGSGKSFFIGQIKDQIAKLKAQQRPELYQDPIEIDFNAWQASDANLWASLVTHIFDEIWAKVSTDAKDMTPEQARAALLKEIDTARGAVHAAEAEVELGRVALAKAEADLEARRQTMSWTRYAQDVTQETLKKAAQRIGWARVPETINEVKEDARALATSTAQLRATATTWISRPIGNLMIPGAIVFVAIAAVWTLWDDPAATAQLGRWVASAAAVLAAVGGPLKLANAKVKDYAAQLGTIEHGYQASLASMSKEQQARVEQARHELDVAESGVAEARKRLADLVSQQALLDPQRRLGAFLQDRVQSTTYRAQQGIIALVHKDFRKLSQYMRDLRAQRDRKADDAAAAGAPIRPFDRIILYVDDLDRCRPEHVVHMLEAVHLLLALDLFVVVVAVDSRWLVRALELHYKDLLSVEAGADDGLRASTPQSYLEKIFQITYALGPMDPKAFAGYVRYLANDEPVAGAGQEVGQGAAASGSGASENGDGAAADGLGVTAHDAAGAGTTTAGNGTNGNGTNGSGTNGGGAAHGANGKPASAPASASAVRIDAREQQLIASLVSLLPTPRIAKRLVNVYRVIKATKNAHELDLFAREDRASSCLLLLAILFGRPAVAPELLRALVEERAPFADRQATLAAAVAQRPTPPGEPPHVTAEWRRLAATLADLGLSTTVAQCAREPLEVARYSLVTGHDWHTWQRA